MVIDMKKHIVFITLILSLFLGVLLFAGYRNEPLEATDSTNVSGITYHTSQMLSDDNVLSPAVPTAISAVGYAGPMYVVEPTGANVRSEPNTTSDIVYTTIFGEQLQTAEIMNSDNADEWVGVVDGDIAIGYIKKQFISHELPQHTDTDVTDLGNFTFKSFTDYRKITDTSTPQYALQQIAYTGNYGIRQINGRYCVALGSRFKCKIGQYFDLLLGDGSIIPCVMCDEKDDSHTDETNTYTVHSNCISEFYVDSEYINSEAMRTGNMSVLPELDSPVVTVRVYDVKI